jgi:hypothetical protein
MITAENRSVAGQQATLVGDEGLRIGKQAFAEYGDSRSQDRLFRLRIVILAGR